MKLFLWRGGDVLRNYSSGIAGALAPDVETARSLVKTQVLATNWRAGFKLDDEDQEYFTQLVRFLEAEPEVFESPVAFHKEGGE